MKTKEEYLAQQSACDGLCDITQAVAQEADYMRCVTCPFCRETVDAILTPTTIACPACEVEVQRS